MDTGLVEILIECDRCHQWWEIRYDPVNVRRCIMLNHGTGPKGRPRRYQPRGI